MEFSEKLGQTALVRCRHGQTGLLTYTWYTKPAPFLPFCLCFPTLVPPKSPQSISFPTFFASPKHPTVSPVQMLFPPPHREAYTLGSDPGLWGDPESLLTDSWHWVSSEHVGLGLPWDSPGAGVGSPTSDQGSGVTPAIVPLGLRG